MDLDSFDTTPACDVSDAEFAVYEHTLLDSSWDTHSAAACAGVGVDEVQSLLEGLVRRGLFRRSVESRDRLTPVAPTVGLAEMAARAEAALLARAAQVQGQNAKVAALTRRYQEQQKATRGRFEVLEGGDATVRRVTELLRGAERLVETVVSTEPSPSTMEQTRAADAALLERVRLRALYLAGHVRRSRDLQSYMTWLVDAGAEVRVGPLLPSRLMLVDRSVALVAIDPLNAGSGALVLHTPGVVDVVATLFDALWADGDSVDDLAGNRVTGLDDIDRAIIRLLAEGLKDEAVSRKLGISVRSVRRSIARIGDEFGAQSRFALGVRCRELGLT